MSNRINHTSSSSEPTPVHCLTMLETIPTVVPGNQSTLELGLYFLLQAGDERSLHLSTYRRGPPIMVRVDLCELPAPVS